MIKEMNLLAQRVCKIAPNVLFFTYAAPSLSPPLVSGRTAPPFPIKQRADWSDSRAAHNSRLRTGRTLRDDRLRDSTHLHQYSRRHQSDFATAGHFGCRIRNRFDTY